MSIEIRAVFSTNIKLGFRFCSIIVNYARGVYYAGGFRGRGSRRFYTGHSAMVISFSSYVIRASFVLSAHVQTCNYYYATIDDATCPSIGRRTIIVTNENGEKSTENTRGTRYRRLFRLLITQVIVRDTRR